MNFKGDEKKGSVTCTSTFAQIVAHPCSMPHSGEDAKTQLMNFVNRQIKPYGIGCAAVACLSDCPGVLMVLSCTRRPIVNFASK